MKHLVSIPRWPGARSVSDSFVLETLAALLANLARAVFSLPLRSQSQDKEAAPSVMP